MTSIVTVLTPAETRDLVSLETVKLDLGITSDADDEFLARAISRASAIIETYCRRVFALEEVREEFFDLTASQILYLARRPVLEVTASPSDGFDLDMTAGRLVGGPWSGDFTIDYTAGYETIPLEIQGAASEIVKALQFSKSRDPMLRSENILSGLYAYTLFDPSDASAGTAKQVAHILDSYTDLVVV